MHRLLSRDRSAPATRPVWHVASPVALALIGLGMASCTGDSRDRDTIESDQFVAAWVELRRATITSETGELTDVLRQRALERAGVTEEQFLTFSEVHGGDLDFMQPVWDSIDVRLDSTILQTPGGEEPPPPDAR